MAARTRARLGWGVAARRRHVRRGQPGLPRTAALTPTPTRPPPAVARRGARLRRVLRRGPSPLPAPPLPAHDSPTSSRSPTATPTPSPRSTSPVSCSSRSGSPTPPRSTCGPRWSPASSTSSCRTTRAGSAGRARCRMPSTCFSDTTESGANDSRDDRAPRRISAASAPACQRRSAPSASRTRRTDG